MILAGVPDLQSETIMMLTFLSDLCDFHFEPRSHDKGVQHYWQSSQNRCKWSVNMNLHKK